MLAVDGDKVKLGIQAPRHVAVQRQELCDAVRLQNLAAAHLNLAAQPQTLETLRQLLGGRAPAPPASG